MGTCLPVILVVGSPTDTVFEIISCLVESIESDSRCETRFESWTVGESREILNLRLVLPES
jgi:hypothetical protein